jgi:hypothetical protein
MPAHDSALFLLQGIGAFPSFRRFGTSADRSHEHLHYVVENVFEIDCPEGTRVTGPGELLDLRSWVSAACSPPYRRLFSRAMAA